MQSESIAALAAALAKAQGQITGALKDSSNPFFKSKYADLASCWDACRKQLSENGLAVIQTTEVVTFQASPEMMAGGVSMLPHLSVKTTLVHSSGEWISGLLPVKTKDDSPQAQGSGLTYARRYALAAIVGLAQIDDDAEAAQARTQPKADSVAVKWGPRSDASFKADPVKVAEYVTRINKAYNTQNNDALLEIQAEAKEDADFAQAVWGELPSQVRSYIKSLKVA